MTDMLKLFFSSHSPSTSLLQEWREKKLLIFFNQRLHFNPSYAVLLFGEFGLLLPFLQLLLLEQVCRPLRKTFQLLLMIMSFLTFCILHWSPCD